MLYAPQYLCAMSNTAYMSGMLDGGSEHYTETLETLRLAPSQGWAVYNLQAFSKL